MSFIPRFVFFLVLLLGTGLAIGYAGLGPHFSPVQTRNAPKTQLAAATCYDVDGYEVDCGGSWGPPDQNFNAPDVPSNDPNAWYGFSGDQNMPPPPDQDLMRYGPYYDQWGNPYDQWGNALGPAMPYDGVILDNTGYTGGFYDQWGNPVDEWGNPIDAWGNSIVVDQSPWYVQAFPGIGSMAQHIIPGLQTGRPVIQPVITVQAQQAPAPRYPQPSCWISAQPTAVNYGGSSVLSWNSFNTNSAALTGLGAVPVQGSYTVPGITGTATFTLQVAGPGGSGSCYTRVDVQQSSGVPSCTISANPGVISSGQSANLAWFSQNASSASLSGMGQVPPQSGISVSPPQSTSYTLVVTNQYGQSSSCVAGVTVQ